MDCLICGEKLGYKKRKFCSKKCSTRFFNQKNKQYNVEWQRKRRDEKATKGDNKVQCLICGKWYIQVGTHIVQVHKMTAKEYRKKFGFDLKRGQIKGEYLKLKRKQVFECGGVENLKGINSEKYRFKKNQKNLGKYERSEQTIKRLQDHIKNISKLIKR